MIREMIPLPASAGISILRNSFIKDEHWDSFSLSSQSSSRPAFPSQGERIRVKFFQKLVFYSRPILDLSRSERGIFCGRYAKDGKW
jgi:hypothetical protein